LITRLVDRIKRILDRITRRFDGVTQFSDGCTPFIDWCASAAADFWTLHLRDVASVGLRAHQVASGSFRRRLAAFALCV
jgi:hypothetical protein